MDEGGAEETPVPLAEALSDAALAIVAGADTTSSVLSGLFRYVLEDREVYRRLQKEIDTAFPASDGNPFDAAVLSNLPLLNAVM